MDGNDIFYRFAVKAGYNSVSQLVAEHTLFTHPNIVEKLQSKNLFRIIRDFKNRGQIIDWEDGKQVMCCDNTGPIQAVVWCNLDFGYSEVQFNHIYSESKDVTLYTSLANICVTPAFLAKLTDTNVEIKNLLKYRSYDLYGFYIGPKPFEPENYSSLKWKEFIAPIDDLEVYLRKRLKSCPKSRNAISARKIGWYFSDYQPDNLL